MSHNICFATLRQTVAQPSQIFCPLLVASERHQTTRNGTHLIGVLIPSSATSSGQDVLVLMLCSRQPFDTGVLTIYATKTRLTH